MCLAIFLFSYPYVLRRHSPTDHYTNIFVVAAVIQSTYCWIWDILMDWGLPQWGGSPRGWSLRQPLLVTPRRGVYWALAAQNLMLRFIWTLGVFGGVPGRGGGALL